MPQTLEEQVDGADVVVSGMLIEAKFVDANYRRASGKFIIHEVLKGQMSGPFIVTTSANHSTGGGVGLAIGSSYILFFRYYSMAIGSCSGSSQYSQERFQKLKEIIIRE
jgi:hypothetical protein